jgi:hypothetical protein
MAKVARFCSPRRNSISLIDLFACLWRDHRRVVRVSENKDVTPIALRAQPLTNSILSHPANRCRPWSTWNVALTLPIAGGAFSIMGDKSPKANQKQKAQQKAKANTANQKKAAAAASKSAPKKK